MNSRRKTKNGRPRRSTRPPEKHLLATQTAPTLRIRRIPREPHSAKLRAAAADVGVVGKVRTAIADGVALSAGWRRGSRWRRRRGSIAAAAAAVRVVHAIGWRLTPA